MGLGSVNNNRGVFLSIAGGYIWNRKAEQSDPDYAVQEYEKKDGEKGKRAGARYANLSGKVTGVKFNTHAEYGENINVNFVADEQTYIISISTNNRNSQDMMKMLLKADLSKEVFMQPYDFIDNTKKRAQGISFRQGGVKVDLRVEDAPSNDKEWFKAANKKDIRRFFEDLSDWFVAEIEEKIIPNFSSDEEPKKGTAQVTKEAPKEAAKEKAPKKEKEEKKETAKVTPLKMKKALRAYIAENYEGEELPKGIKGEELKNWYDLCQAEEELPFDETAEEETETPKKKTESLPDAEVADLDDKLNSLLDDEEDGSDIPF